jgi:hypothetical protein
MAKLAEGMTGIRADLTRQIGEVRFDLKAQVGTLRQGTGSTTK